METLTIHDLDGGALAFNLRDLLRVLAPLSLVATWTIRSPRQGGFEATGAGGIRLEQLADASARVVGNELLSIADDTVQVIWGEFVAELPDDPRQEWLIIRAIDSSYFEVATSDQTSIAAIKSSFKDVRIS